MIRRLRSLLAPTTILGAVLSTHYRLHNRHLLARAAEGCPDEVPAPDESLTAARAAFADFDAALQAEEDALYHMVLSEIVGQLADQRDTDADFELWARQFHPANGGQA